MIYTHQDFLCEGAKEIQNIRSLTGADAIVSTKSIPPTTEVLIKKHVEVGAVFYRIVTCRELADNDPGLFLSNQNRLIELGCKSWQMVLVVVDPPLTTEYARYLMMCELWIEHGGSTLTVQGDVSGFLTKKEQRMMNDDGKSVSIVLPVIGPRKVIQMVKDWTVTLATFPGVGYQGSVVIRNMIKERGLGDDLLTALWFLTDEQELESDSKLRQIRIDARKWLGLPDGFNLDIGEPKRKEI